MKQRHRKAHRRAWIVLAVALPLIIAAALLLRQNPDDLPPNERLAPPSAATEGEG